MWQPMALPGDTAALLSPGALRGCRNLGLLLDRFQPWQPLERSDGWDLQFAVEEQRQGMWQVKQPPPKGNEVKGWWFSTTMSRGRGRAKDRPLLMDEHLDGELLAAQHGRWLSMVAAFGADAALCFDLVAVAPLVVGLGADTVLETSLCLQRVVGQPLIPGSALKGLTHTLALCELAETLGVPIGIPEPRADDEAQQKLPETALRRLSDLLDADLDPKEDSARAEVEKQLKALQKEQAVKAQAGPIAALDLAGFRAHEAVCRFRAVFGYVGGIGRVRFFDALPQPGGRLNFRADVMNVHFSDYYRNTGGKPPYDYDKLSPVAFLTIGAGAGFSFAVAPLRDSDRGHALVARSWLEQALREVGVGAKTSAGYGLFGDQAPPAPRSGGMRDREPNIPRARPIQGAPAAPERTPAGGPETGKIKRFDDMRGFGFIQPEAGGADLFIHMSNIVGKAIPIVGQRVSFQRRPSRQGKEEAYDVKLLA